MTDRRESWERTRGHLSRAAELAGLADAAAFREDLDHNELALAADTLVERVAERDDLAPAFWEAVACAYENMGVADRAARCRFRIQEAQYGFVEVMLTLSPTAQGGRRTAISTGYPPDWNLGDRTESGDPALTGATVTLEDAAAIAPGGSGRVRLHPRVRDRWQHVKAGAVIEMHEGSRVVGRAVVVRVALRTDAATRR
jgi:hypothetical protein